jgi:predicted aconitase with swiveling domain
VKIKAKLKPIVPGEAEGSILKFESLSFYGEVDPKKGIIIETGESVRGKILVIWRSRGSTVGSYIIYGLRYYCNEPAAIVMGRSEPIVITGSILAEIPLYEGLPRRVFDLLTNGMIARINKSGELVAYNP